MPSKFEMHEVRRQRGAVLVVSLLLLLVMTMLALAASQATRMQERMAGNARDHELAFQSAEAGLRAGERFVDSSTLTSAPTPCSSSPPCQVYELGYLTDDVSYQNIAWWKDNATTYSTSSQISSSASSAVASREPMYFIEELEEVTDSLTVSPTGPPPSRMYYRITSNGAGGSTDETTQVVLQSTFARRFN